MFFQPPEEEAICSKSKTLKHNTKSRRQKKLRRKNKLKAVKKDQHKKHTRSPIPITMSSWAENFTSAATWQLKHQVAFWKSKATALEYENKLLHDIIRKNCLNGTNSANSSNTNSDQEDIEEEYFGHENEVEESGDGEIEVSEEFIQFLRENKKYRDDAKRERERLRALNDDQGQIEEMEAGPVQITEDPQDVLKRLYGNDWEKISALETSLRSQFINICDREKPIYWPNIPFNFNLG